MFFGLDGDKLILIGFAAVLLLGPERLPQLAEMLARFTVRARDWVNGAKDRVKDEMGDEFDDIEWRKLDPRQYDPRRIIRDALIDEPPVPAPAAAAPVLERPRPAPRDPDAPVPFDSEAT